MTEHDTILKEAKATFAKRIKNALEEKGCDTRAEKAEFLGVSTDIIGNYERGESFPPIGQLVCYARKLGCSIEYLTNKDVTIKTPDTGVKAIVQATGLSEEASKLLVIMKKKYKPQLAALDALLVSCLPYDPGTKQFRYDGLSGILVSNAEYFRVVNQIEKEFIQNGGEVIEDPSARDLARIRMMDSTINLLNGAEAMRLCSIYRKNLERLEATQDQKEE